ncbi:MAG TPA: efflux RND transporter permease subunit [Saprospiraceae bacterium]|nr:efflux RND transporter permease subunit [Saprospiraceae bacterium]
MNNPDKNRRQFSLSSLAVDNGTSVILIAIMIILFGTRSYRDMPKEQFPDASLPTVYINTSYFGNSAKEIENLITRPIEKEIEAISGIKDVKSTSIQDFSVIICEFVADMEMEEALRKTKDAVDKAKSELPNDLDEDPTILEVAFADFPIITVNISGKYSNDELEKYADYLEDRIKGIKQIAKVEKKGVLETEIKIDADLARMQSLKVSFGDIENAVRSENMTMSAGELVRNDFRRSIRVIGQFESISEIENLIIKSENGRPIFLNEIAKVSRSYKERTSYARADGLPVISLNIIKRKGENLIYAIDNMKAVIESNKKNLPEDLSITYFNDQSINTQNQVDNLENSIISGVILVTLVLLFFLGLRNATFVGLAIPLSMLMGILILNITGATMNIVVLFSLILALGLLVDNAIVVVENIYRFMQNGYSGLDAAKYGAGEVAWPIIASTATTLAAFLPLAFWPGIMGEFLLYMPLTLIIVLTSSLFVALVINPVLTSRFMKVDKRAETEAKYRRKRNNILLGMLIMGTAGILSHITGLSLMRNIMGFAFLVTGINFFILRRSAFHFQNRIIPKLEVAYDRFISFALRGRKPILLFLGTFLLLAFALVLLAIKSPKVIYFPTSEPLYINVFVDLPLGRDIEATNRIVKDIEKKVDEVIESRRHIVEAVLTQIGEDTADPMSPPEPGVTPHKARITIAFVKAEDRGTILTSDIMADLRKEMKEYPGIQIAIGQNASGPPTGKPINLEIRGEELDQLLKVSSQVLAYIESQNIPGIEELKTDVSLGKPELLVNINRDEARRYEISTYNIANAIRTSIFGLEVSKFKEGENDYPIMLRADEKSRGNIAEVMNQKITFRDPGSGKINQVPISSVAKAEYSATYNAIKRINSERVITIYSNILDGYNANVINSDISLALQSYPFPEGISYAFTGEQLQQAEDMGFLQNAFMIALFSIFIIIVAQFNSIVKPFIIIISVLFSTIGVFLGYAITGMDITVIFSGVGIISLAGVVVNNAIVLIDYINLLIKEKCDELGVQDISFLSRSDVIDCIERGGATRLRPVLLTAITTILGLIPLAIGFNFNFFTLISDLDPNIFIGGDNTAIWGPMAWTIIYGLIFATFLTLIIIPVMYWLAYRSTQKVKKLFNFKPALIDE